MLALLLGLVVAATILHLLLAVAARVRGPLPLLAFLCLTAVLLSVKRAGDGLKLRPHARGKGSSTAAAVVTRWSSRLRAVAPPRS